MNSNLRSASILLGSFIVQCLPCHSIDLLKVLLRLLLECRSLCTHHASLSLTLRPSPTNELENCGPKYAAGQNKQQINVRIDGKRFKSGLTSKTVLQTDFAAVICTEMAFVVSWSIQKWVNSFGIYQLRCSLWQQLRGSAFISVMSKKQGPNRVDWFKPGSIQSTPWPKITSTWTKPASTCFGQTYRVVHLSVSCCHFFLSANLVLGRLGFEYDGGVVRHRRRRPKTGAQKSSFNLPPLSIQSLLDWRPMYGSCVNQVE